MTAVTDPAAERERRDARQRQALDDLRATAIGLVTEMSKERVEAILAMLRMIVTQAKPPADVVPFARME